jgi:hypothetical protein
MIFKGSQRTIASVRWMGSQLCVELLEDLLSGLFSLRLEKLIGGLECGNDELEH